MRGRMAGMDGLKIGSHVRVVDDYFQLCLRGATGVITIPGDNGDGAIPADQFWVELDELVPADDGGLIEAGAFLETHLQALQ
jgi:hypothetical protein